MRKIIILLLITLSGYGQQKDSIIEKKVDKSIYFRSMFSSLVSDGFTDINGDLVKESLSNRFIQNIEVGGSFGVLDIGIDVGKINTVVDKNLDLKQRTLFECKLTMDACQYGIFSNEITIGGGYIIKSQTPIILELSSTILAQVYDNFGIGVVYGAYELTGNNFDVNKTFTGLFLRYGLMRSDGGFLLHRTKFNHKNIPHHTIK